MSPGEAMGTRAGKLSQAIPDGPRHLRVAGCPAEAEAQGPEALAGSRLTPAVAAA